MLLALTRYDVPEAEGDGFVTQAHAALGALSARPGWGGGALARAVDDVSVWVMSTRWDTVGAYRRALSHPEVKLHAVPLMYRCRDEVTSFEVILDVEAGGEIHRFGSDVAG